MLKDMRHTCGVGGDGAKSNQKHIFWIVGRQMDMWGAGVNMTKFVQIDVQRADVLAADMLESRMADRHVHGCVALLGRYLWRWLSIRTV